MVDTTIPESTNNNNKRQKMTGGTSVRDRLKPDTMVKVLFGSEDTPPRFVIAYWSIKGLSAPLRAMLSAAQANHEIALYDAKESGDHGWDFATYAEDKKWLKEEHDCFLNLPFLVDTQRNLVISQTNAIFAYLGRELNMLGNDEEEQVKTEECLCEAMDFRDKMIHFVYQTGGGKDDAVAVMHKIKPHLHKFEAHLAKEYPDYFKKLAPSGDKNSAKTVQQATAGVNHLVGHSFSAPDFHLWEMLDQYEALAQFYDLPFWAQSGDEKNKAVNFACRDDIKPLEDRLMPHLEDFKANFMLLPENAAYANSFCHKELPCNNCMGSFASTTAFHRYARGQDAPWRKKGEFTERHDKME